METLADRPRFDLYAGFMHDVIKEFGFQWHVTDHCNLRCAHCYQDDFSRHSERTVAALCTVADKIFDGLKDRWVSVNLTGGEPLLYPGLLPLIEYLHTKENLKEVHLITNGTVSKERLLREIGKFPKVDLLKVSLESADASINDGIRGKGNLGIVRNNLGRYKELTGKRVVLMCTLARHNAASIPEFVRFARNEAAAGVIFERFVPLGRGRDIEEEVLNEDEWRETVASICLQAGYHIEPEELASFRALWLWTDHLRAEKECLLAARCNLGAASMALMPNGDVYPCRRLPLVLGNILRDSVEDILPCLGEYEDPGVTGCRALFHAAGLDVDAEI